MTVSCVWLERKYGSVAGSTVVGGGGVVLEGSSMEGANPPTPHRAVGGRERDG